PDRKRRHGPGTLEGGVFSARRSSDSSEESPAERPALNSLVTAFWRIFGRIAATDGRIVQRCRPPRLGRRTPVVDSGAGRLMFPVRRCLRRASPLSGATAHPTEGPHVRTFTPKAADITREWHVIDADGAILGRLATEVATLLRGKHKPIWAPHLD